MNFIVDIDDTLIKSDFDGLNYSNPRAIVSEIDLVNKMYDEGHTIILHTGRGWHHLETTINQLREFNIKYNSLVLGKPSGVYIDATNNYRSISEVEID